MSEQPKINTYFFGTRRKQLLNEETDWPEGATTIPDDWGVAFTNTQDVLIESDPQ